MVARADCLRMRHRVTLQRVTRTANAMNEQEESWTDLGSRRWANVEGQSGREVRRANQNTPTATHQVTMRSDNITKSLTADDRITWHGPGGDIVMGIVYVDLSQVAEKRRVVCLCEASL